MIKVILYSRDDCHLCSQAQDDLKALQNEFPHSLAVVDIDSSPALQRQYGLEVPVIEIGSMTLRAPISRDELRQALVAAQAPRPAQASSAPAYQPTPTWTRSDSLTYWLSKHYLAALNAIVALYFILPFVAPALMKVGLETPAALIYRVYGATCHQLAYRSFFLFGEQAVYPRQAAHVQGELTFNQATGLSEASDTPDIFAARAFIGNPVVGYKVALCQRDMALYGSILLFGLIYAATGRRIPPLPWYLWVLFGILPVALDGFSQLFSQPPLNFISYRESTPFLRVLTGGLFGFMTAWFAYPIIDRSMRDTVEMMEVKQRKVQAIQGAAAAADPAD